MRLLSVLLATLLTTVSLSACAYDGKKPLPDQDHLPEEYRSGQQVRIENNHYLILDSVRAYHLPDAGQRRAASVSRELARKENYSIQPGSVDAGRPVVWNQARQRYAVLLDELGLTLTHNEDAQQLAADYDMTLTLQIKRLKRAYFRLDANRIPGLMRKLQQDERVTSLMPSLLERSRKPM